MALVNYNGRFCEQDFENAIIQMFEDAGWQYTFGDDIPRDNGNEVLIIDELRGFIRGEYPFLLPEEVEELVNKIRLVGAESEFATLMRLKSMMPALWTFGKRNQSLRRNEPIRLLRLWRICGVLD